MLFFSFFPPRFSETSAEDRGKVVLGVYLLDVMAWFPPLWISLLPSSFLPRENVRSSWVPCFHLFFFPFITLFRLLFCARLWKCSHKEGVVPSLKASPAEEKKEPHGRTGHGSSVHVRHAWLAVAKGRES